jgi:hypothetical protein
MISSAADGSDTIHELHAVRRMTQYRVVIAEMRNSKQGRKLEVQINESENASLAQEKRTHQNLSVTAPSYYDDWQLQSVHPSITAGGSS